AAVERATGGAAPRSPVKVSDFALSTDAAWLATDHGLWRLSADGGKSVATNATLLTPLLRSPIGTVRGWSRAELTVAFGDDVALEASYASTTDDRLVAEVKAIATNTHLTEARRQELIWLLLDGDADQARHFAIQPPEDGEVVSIPLFGSDDEWL